MIQAVGAFLRLRLEYHSLLSVELPILPKISICREFYLSAGVAVMLSGN